MCCIKKYACVFAVIVVKKRGVGEMVQNNYRGQGIIRNFHYKELAPPANMIIRNLGHSRLFKVHYVQTWKGAWKHQKLAQMQVWGLTSLVGCTHQLASDI